ncbi:MAG: PQQ-binding-like beta-propeller repeat protein [Chloroflexota bacterium]
MSPLTRRLVVSWAAALWATSPIRLAHAAIGPRQLTLRWYVSTAADVDGAPAIAPDGTVYVASTNGTIYGLSADGGQRWSISAGASVLGSVALGPEGRLYVGDSRGRFRAIQQVDGTVLWSLDGYGAIRSTPAVATDGRIYFGTDAGELVSLEPDGRERFRLRAELDVTGAPAIGPEGDLIWGSRDGKLRRASTGGDGSWTAVLDGPILSAPVLSAEGSTVYVGSGQSVLAVDRASGGVRWRVGAGADVVVTPAVGPNGAVHAGALNGQFFAISPAGEVTWQAQAGGQIRSSAAVSSDGNVYFGAGDAIVYAYSASGQRLSTYRALDAVHGAAAIDAAGTVYAGSRDNRLYAFRENARTFAESPPDRLGGDLVRDAGTGRVFVIVAGRRRHIPDTATQLLLGLAGPLPLTLNAAEANRYPEGPALPALGHGSLARAANGPLYVVRDGKRVWIKSLDEFAAAGLRWEDVRDLEDIVVRSVSLQTESGLLVKGGGDRVYLLEGGVRRWVSTEAAFEARGFSWSNVHLVSESFLGNVAEGASL